MKLDRRNFLTGALTTTVAGKLAFAAPLPPAPPAAARKGEPDLSTWPGVRAEFLLSKEYVHMALMLLASHPRPVREAIDRFRRGLDEDPVTFGMKNFESAEKDVRGAAADYIGAKPDEIALTGS